MDETLLDIAKKFLIQYLRKGILPSIEVRQAGLDAGISLATLGKAKAELGIKHFKEKNQTYWEGTRRIFKKDTTMKKSAALYDFFVGVKKR